MQQSAIFFPSTPSQRRASDERRARLMRLNCLPPIPNIEMQKACDLASAAVGEALPAPVYVLGEIEKIQRVVIAHFPDVTMVDLKSARRTAMLVRPRRIAMYLAKELTGRSFPEIGRRFGGRDHTTVLHAVRMMKEELARNPQTVAFVEAIKADIAGIS